MCALCEHAHERNPLRFVHEIAGEVNNISHELRFMHALDFPIPQWIKAESPHAAIWPSTPRPRPSATLQIAHLFKKRGGREEWARHWRWPFPTWSSSSSSVLGFASPNCLQSCSPSPSAFALQSCATPPSDRLNPFTRRISCSVKKMLTSAF